MYDPDWGSEPNLTDLEATKKAIETAHMICYRANASYAELQVEIPTLFECMKCPIVSMGVLRWVEHTMLEPTFFEEAAESSSLFLVLLDEVNTLLLVLLVRVLSMGVFCFFTIQAAACHKLQHPFILELLKKLIEGSYPMLEVSVQVKFYCFVFIMQVLKDKATHNVY